MSRQDGIFIVAMVCMAGCLFIGWKLMTTFPTQIGLIAQVFFFAGAFFGVGWTVIMRPRLRPTHTPESGQ